MTTERRAVMVVDDDPDVRETVCDVLALQGYDVVPATNGQEALDILRARSHRIGVIVLDLMMPVLDGWRFREIQAADAELAAIPVIVVTASGRVEDLDDGVTVLKKPLRLEQLLAAVAAHA
jgi:CheY-like chemotaxis protein